MVMKSQNLFPSIIFYFDSDSCLNINMFWVLEVANIFEIMINLADFC